VSYWVKTRSTSQNEDQTAWSALLGGRRSEELDPGDLRSTLNQVPVNCGRWPCRLIRERPGALESRVGSGEKRVSLRRLESGQEKHVLYKSDESGKRWSAGPRVV
jgi:hypothetical protein